MFDPVEFKFKQLLSTNPAEKRVVAIGQVDGQEGEAIMVVNAKMPDQQKYTFTEVHKVFQNDIYWRFDVKMEGEYEIQAIYPVTEKHKAKYRLKDMQLVKQSAQSYQIHQQEMLQKELAHIDWVHNIIEGRAEADRVLLKQQ